MVTRTEVKEALRSQSEDDEVIRVGRAKRRRGSHVERAYPRSFYLPGGIVFGLFFLLPTAASFYFALTRWSLFEIEFIGLDNFATFFREPMLLSSFSNTFIYALITSGAKVVIALPLAAVLSSRMLFKGFVQSVVFFPVLVSTIGVGVTFEVIMDPFGGLLNEALAAIGVIGPAWLTDPSLALYSVALVDIWKGLGLATLIYVAGIAGIPREYYEAATVDGAGALRTFRSITVPLARPATISVITLSLIGGLRSFDLIWAMTGGGPGFSSEVVASAIYKQYQSGFYGLSTAGNVVLFAVVAIIIVPLNFWLNRKGSET